MAVSHAQLKAFHAVATCGSFTRAAERLCLSQPAVSDQVHKLEERFGVLLFYRNKRRVQLSELGEKLLAVTQRLFVLEEQAQELLSSSRALQSGRLILAMDSPVHLLGCLRRFHGRYPGIQIQISSSNTDLALEKLFSYQADMAVLGRQVDDPRLHCLALSHSPLIAFVSHSHPWHKRESVELADLASVPMVLREQGSMTRQMVEQELTRIGLTAHPAIEVEGREAVRELVLAGLGVGVVSSAEFSTSEQLHPLPIRDCTLCMTETLVCLHEQKQRRLIETFLQVVEGAGHELSSITTFSYHC